MNTPEVQRLKMAWLAAKEAGDVETQMSLLRDHPGEQAALIDFIAAYHASAGDALDPHESELLPLTQRACRTALERVFAPQPAFANLGELRKSRRLSKVDVASGLRLSVDVWNKFEAGAIELASLSRRQLERLASFFQIGAEQFGTLLNQSQPALTLNRRQTREASLHEQQGPKRQSFAEALARSTMSKEDQRFWLEEEE
ncbi:MAG TPA: helix-turn-helix transcriptional regulator [Ktedonobacteraceae bacterium]|jgi:transcriptional regulator with XRE-family HTH domain|nr:helix-turn-helix transcriptional regulator [Ktedonobacteraceae bacterium]